MPPDYITSVDILKQSIKDLRSKPFWDTYEQVKGTITFDGSTSYTIANGTFSGVILFAIFSYKPTSIFSHLDDFIIELEGVDAETYHWNELIFFSFPNIIAPIQVYQYEDTLSVFRFGLNSQRHFTTSYAVKMTASASLTGTIDYQLLIGKNI